MCMCNDCIMCINWVLFTWWMKKTKNNVSSRVCRAVVGVLLCQVGRSMVLGVHIESRFLVPHLVCLLIPHPFPCKASHSSYSYPSLSPLSSALFASRHQVAPEYSEFVGRIWQGQQFFFSRMWLCCSWYSTISSQCFPKRIDGSFFLMIVIIW